MKRHSALIWNFLEAIDEHRDDPDIDAMAQALEKILFRNADPKEALKIKSSDGAPKVRDYTLLHKIHEWRHEGLTWQQISDRAAEEGFAFRNPEALRKRYAKSGYPGKPAGHRIYADLDDLP